MNKIKQKTILISVVLGIVLGLLTVDVVEINALNEIVANFEKIVFSQ